MEADHPQEAGGLLSHQPLVRKAALDRDRTHLYAGREAGIGRGPRAAAGRRARHRGCPFGARVTNRTGRDRNGHERDPHGRRCTSLRGRGGAIRKR